MRRAGYKLKVVWRYVFSTLCKLVLVSNMKTEFKFVSLANVHKHEEGSRGVRLLNVQNTSFPL